MVQHRGFPIIFMAVREWLKHRPDRFNTEKVLVAGSSAAHGALMNFSRLHRIYPSKTKISLLSDAGAGVFTNNFLNTVFEPNGPWGTENTLATWIPGINQISSYNELNFFTQFATGIERYFDKSKFAVRYNCVGWRSSAISQYYEKDRSGN